MMNNKSDMRTLGTGGGGSDAPPPDKDKNDILNMILTVKGNDVFFAGHIFLAGDAKLGVNASEDELARHLERRIISDFLKMVKKAPADHPCTFELRLGTGNGLSLPIRAKLASYKEWAKASKELEEISGKYKGLLEA